MFIWIGMAGTVLGRTSGAECMEPTHADKVSGFDFSNASLVDQPLGKPLNRLAPVV